MVNNETLRAKIATLTAENRKLKKIAKNSGLDLQLDKVQTDTEMLLVWRFSDMSISREAVGELGMTRRRWQWARALLQLARVHDGVDITVDEFTEALGALRETVALLRRDGLESLRMKMPQHVVLESFYKRQQARFGRDTGKNVSQDAGNTGAQTADQDGGKLQPTSREKSRSQEITSRGTVRDRRAEIEARLAVREE